MTPALEKNPEKRIKRQIVGKPKDFLVYTPIGFEQTFIREMAEFGIGEKDEGKQGQILFTVADGKVYFSDKLSDALEVLACSRIAGRFLMKVDSFKATNFGQLEKHLEQIPWELYIGDSGNSTKIATRESPKITVTCKHSRLYHSDAIKETFEKALKDKNSSQTLVVDFEDDRCTIWLDLSHAEMYKRGFERFVERAPLKEHLAYAALYEAGISTATAIIDPMAGSGTFSLEAYMYGEGIVPGIMRHFDYEKAPFFKKAAWDFLVSHAKSQRKQISIHASDLQPKAVETVRHNFKALAKVVHSDILQPNIAVADFFSLDFSKIKDNSILALNPPYGIRLKVDETTLYRRIGEKLNRELRSDPGKTPGKKISVVIFVPGKDCLEALNIQYDKRIHTNHGGINLDVIFKVYHEL
ncbi:MAG: hypothetical protein HUK20_02085 [Fibrobacter sp.]|nr:hypothetical protein [Fibrobacter sp.]